jgi:large repetitive protein
MLPQYLCHSGAVWGSLTTGIKMRNIHLFLVTVLLAGFAEAQSSSSVTLAPSLNPSNYGRAVTLTASVTPGATGKVTFYDGTTVVGTSNLNAGQAIFTTVLLPSGTRYLRAHYSGDSAYNPGNSAVVAQTVLAQPSLGLGAPVNYTVGGAQQAVVGDFNGDGKPDLAVTAFPGTPSGSILLGNGDGTFQVTSMNLAAYMISLAAGDFNEDGKQDLAYVDLTTGLLSVALGNGDGTFGAPATYPVGSTSIDPAVVVGDFNGDGISDLAVSLGASVGIMLGNGDGTFKGVVKYPAPNAVMLALGDFNGDGNTDIVAGGQVAMSLTILSGNGDGTFQTPVMVATPTYPAFIVVADFDADGKADLALAFSGTNYVYVLLGNGNGTFQSPEGYVAGPAGNWSLATGDVDGDGRLDLIFLELDADSLSILPGNGDGTFQSPAGYAAGSGIALRYAVVGDFNADGKTDVAAIIGGQVGVLLGGAVPDLSISLAPGPGFTQGQVGATYTITVTNPSTLSSSGAVSVVDTLPPGFTATGISGGGWTCILPTLSCTRSDPLAPSGSYPGITITTNISASTTGTAVDNATVSSGNDQNPANNTLLQRPNLAGRRRVLSAISEWQFIRLL